MAISGDRPFTEANKADVVLEKKKGEKEAKTKRKRVKQSDQ